jgi:hypothetical protein
MEYSLSQRLGSFVGKPFDPNDLENATLELWLNVYDGVYSGGTLFDPSAGATRVLLMLGRINLTTNSG